MPNDHCSTGAEGPAGRAIDRRTMLAGAAGALLGIALNWPSPAWARATSRASLAGTDFDPALARRLQQVLDEVVASSKGPIPGVVLHAEGVGHGSWTGAAGLRRLAPGPADRRARSVLA